MGEKHHIGRTIFLSATLLMLIASHAYFILENPFDSQIIGNAVAEDSEKGVDLDTKEKIILAAEWILVFVILIKILIQGKVEFKEYDLEISKEKVKAEISDTDLDTLYNLLKKKKRIPTKKLAEYFKVKESTIITWARILEEADLLTIHYPSFGHPILILKEEKDESKER